MCYFEKLFTERITAQYKSVTFVNCSPWKKVSPQIYWFKCNSVTHRYTNISKTFLRVRYLYLICSYSRQSNFLFGKKNVKIECKSEKYNTFYILFSFAAHFSSYEYKRSMKYSMNINVVVYSSLLLIRSNWFIS